MVTFGLANGVVKDYDTKQKLLSGEYTQHKAPVLHMHSKAEYVVTASKDRIVVYSNVSFKTEAEWNEPGATFVQICAQTAVVYFG